MKTEIPYTVHLTNCSQASKLDGVIRIKSRNNFFAFEQARESMEHVVLLLLKTLSWKRNWFRGQFLAVECQQMEPTAQR